MINVYECCLETIIKRISKHNIENEAMSQQQKRENLMKYLIAKSLLWMLTTKYFYVTLNYYIIKRMNSVHS